MFNEASTFSCSHHIINVANSATTNRRTYCFIFFGCAGNNSNMKDFLRPFMNLFSEKCLICFKTRETSPNTLISAPIIATGDLHELICLISSGYFFSTKLTHAGQQLVNMGNGPLPDCKRKASSLASSITTTSALCDEDKDCKT